jgi:hypothetical protein
MDVVLLTLTALSLAAAAGFGALSWRVGLEERERSRARIAALSTAMDGGHSSDAGRTRIAVGSVVDRVRAEGGDAALGGRPLIQFAAIGVMTIAIVVGSLVGYRTHGSAATAISSAPAPLELMSMRYQHEGTNLTVSGLVRNPSGGSSVNGVTAVVFAFDRNGGFVASGRVRRHRAECQRRGAVSRQLPDRRGRRSSRRSSQCSGSCSGCEVGRCVPYVSVSPHSHR